MNRLIAGLVGLVLLCLAGPGPVEAQDTTNVLSDKQLRQRVSFALQRFDNLYDELQATEQHLNILLEELNKRVRRDSLRDVFVLDSVQVRLDGEPVARDTVRISVGETAQLSAALFRGGEIVGCSGACQGVEANTYAVTPAGRSVVLASRDLQEKPLPVPKEVYDRAYLEAGLSGGPALWGFLAILIIGGLLYSFKRLDDR